MGATNKDWCAVQSGTERKMTFYQERENMEWNRAVEKTLFRELGLETQCCIPPVSFVGLKLWPLKILPITFYKSFFSSPRDGVSTTSLSSLFQYLKILSINFFSLIFNLKLPWQNLRNQGLGSVATLKHGSVNGPGRTPGCSSTQLWRLQRWTEAELLMGISFLCWRRREGF